MLYLPLNLPSYSHVAMLSSLHTLTVMNEAKQIMEVLSTSLMRRYFTSISMRPLISDLVESTHHDWTSRDEDLSGIQVPSEG
jgi:hypothetical protein